MLQKLFSKFSGRSTAFFIAFFTTGTTLHILHRLDSTFIGFMTSLLTFVVGHSIKESLVDDKNKNGGDDGGK